MPVSIGSTRCTGAGPAPFFACVRCALAVLFVIGGSLAPVVGTVCLGRRDSHADQGAVATQFSSSTGAGTSPAGMSQPPRTMCKLPVDVKSICTEFRAQNE